MMLPGVELARRRRLHHRNDIHVRGPSEPSFVTPPQPIDEPTAAAARRRLEEKLHRPLSGSRSPSSLPSIASHLPRWIRPSTPSPQNSSNQVHITREHSPAFRQRNGGMGKRSSEFLDRPSRTEICAVCLEGFRVLQQVIWLPCAHRYHSTCVLPWLAEHPHCPYCRTEVPSLELLNARGRQ